MPPRFLDEMTMGAGHSILLSHISNSVNLNSLNETFYKACNKDRKSISSYGLFGSGLDYNTYYPDVTPEEFNPNESDFIEPVFRMLSNCIVSKNYTPTEFSEEVLKASMNLLVGQTVNCDHETSVGNAIGVVKEVFWQDSYRDESGVIVPGGINAKLKIDSKANPRIARGINMDPPSIHSNSVTVQFEWKPSHNFENPWEFWEKLGTYDEKGEMIRRIVTKIISFKETSLVSHGADPYAQKIENNRIVNPGYADAVYNSFSEDAQRIIKEKISHSRAFYMDFKDSNNESLMYNTSKNINRGTDSNQEQSNTHQQNLNKKNMNELLAQLFGEGMLTLAEGTSPSSELVLSEIKRIVSENVSLSEVKSTLESTINSLKEEVSSLKEKVKSSERFSSIGENHFNDVKSSTLASYRKLMGEGKEDANIVTLIESVDNIDTLISLKDSYENQLKEKFPLHCNHCGSKDISRASSLNSEDSNGETKPEDKTINSVISEIARKKL